MVYCLWFPHGFPLSTTPSVDLVFSITIFLTDSILCNVVIQLYATDEIMFQSESIKNPHTAIPITVKIPIIATTCATGCKFPIHSILVSLSLCLYCQSTLACLHPTLGMNFHREPPSHPQRIG